MSNKTIKKRLAIFEYLPTDLLAGFQTALGPNVANKGQFRISEYVDIEFPAIPYEEALPEVITSIDKEIESITNDAVRRCDELKQRRQELLALTVQP